MWFAVRLCLIAVGGFSGGMIAFTDVAATTPPVRWIDSLVILGVTPFMLLAVVGIQAINPFSGKVWNKPSWQSNPFYLGDPLQFFHVAAFHFIAAGAIGLVGAFLKPSGSTALAGFFLSAGVGSWLGIQLAMVVYKKKFMRG